MWGITENDVSGSRVPSANYWSYLWLGGFYTRLSMRREQGFTQVKLHKFSTSTISRIYNCIYNSILYAVLSSLFMPDIFSLSQNSLPICNFKKNVRAFKIRNSLSLSRKKKTNSKIRKYSKIRSRSTTGIIFGNFITFYYNQTSMNPLRS